MPQRHFTRITLTLAALVALLVMASAPPRPQGLAGLAGHAALSTSDKPRQTWADTLNRETEGGPVKPDYPQEALDWWLLAHRDENGFIPFDGMLRAKEQADAMRAAQGVQPAAGISSSRWTSIGPGNIGGRVRGLVIHPTTPSTMFAGGVDGGLWKTTDGGVSWFPINDFLANLAVSSIVFRPGDPMTMYAATGEGFYNADGIRGAGILKSTDGGNTWAILPSTSGTNFQWVNRLAMSADGNTLLAGTRVGLFRSLDQGANFSLVLMPTSFPAPIPGRNDIADVKFLAGSNTNAVASGYSGNAYFSLNGGANWSVAAGGPAVVTTTALRRVEIGVAVSNPQVVYLSYDHQNSASGQIWRSNDGGMNYGGAPLSTPAHLSAQGWYDNVVWVDPTNPETIIVGGIDLFRNTTGGTGTFTKISSWQASPTSAHADHHIIVSHPGYNGTTNRQVFFGNDGGMYVAQDALAPPVNIGGGLFSIPFTELNNNFGVTQFYYGAGHAPTGKIIGGTQDNGTLLFTPAAGPHGWIFEFGGDGGASAIDATDPNYLYGEHVRLSLHRADNGTGPASFIFGLSGGGCKPPPYCLTDAFNGIANFIAPMILDPNQQQRLLGGGQFLWRTNDARAPLTPTTGPTWATIRDPNTNNLPPGFIWPISAIAVAEGNADNIWVGYNNGDLYVTMNGTAVTPTWVKVDDNATPIANRQILDIEFDPANANVVYVTVGGFTSDNVWRTTNGGTSWADRSGSLPDVPVRSIQVHPNNSSWLYVGSEIGVFTSTDAGATWNLPQDGPANVSVAELFWMDTTLVAATHGRGMYVTQTSTVTMSLTPGNLYFGATKNGAAGAIASVTPPQDVTVSFSSGSFPWAAVSDSSWIQVTNGSGVGSGKFTVSITNPGNIIGGATNLWGQITVHAPTAPIANRGVEPLTGAATPIVIRLNIQQTVGASATTFGQVDTPAQSATNQVGAIGVTGWALDDIGVNVVKIFRNCLAFDPAPACQMVLGHNVVFIGDATFVAGARPDVEAAFPTMPMARRAGWGLQVLSNMLPHVPSAQPNGGQGTLQLYAIAFDIEGQAKLLGRTTGDSTPTTITMNNDNIAVPFGTGDSPAPGATVSGTIAAFSWALTPDTDTIPGNGDILIPIDGSTMNMFIDSVQVASVAYNQCRGNVGNPPPPGVFCNDDVSNIFGNTTVQPPLTTRTSNPTRYRNLDAARGPIGSNLLNTTTLPNGVHTIAWVVFDSNGRGEGIGSRFFTILNGGSVTTTTNAIGSEAPRVHGNASQLDYHVPLTGTVWSRTGFDLGRTYEALPANGRGVRAVRLPHAGRLEISLGGPVEAAYLVANGELRDLPIGTSLDRETGHFGWMPAVGFVGTYRLAFVRASGRMMIDVTIGETVTVSRPVKPRPAKMAVRRR